MTDISKRQPGRSSAHGQSDDADNMPLSDEDLHGAQPVSDVMTIAGLVKPAPEKDDDDDEAEAEQPSLSDEEVDVVMARAINRVDRWR
jgi:hypothetical protein